MAQLGQTQTTMNIYLCSILSPIRTPISCMS
uniref:Uncharacterized protein n=1 Tax=Arundo donax TaxID=35708 RepID=A0A0A9A8J7_ARUDO